MPAHLYHRQKKNPKIPSGIKCTNVLSGLWKNGQTPCYSLFSFSRRMKQQAFSTRTSFSLELKRKLEMRWGTYKVVSISRCVLRCLLWNLRTVLEIADVFPSGQGGRHATASRSIFPIVPFFPLSSEFRPPQKRACFLHLCLCLFSSESSCFCVLACLGFTTQQAEIIVSALVKITETNMNIVYSDTVTKVQQVMRAGWVGTLEIRKQDITCNKYSSGFLDGVPLKSVW